MQSTPRYAFPYPEGTDTPDMAYWQQQLAQAVEDVLTPGPWTAASNLSADWDFTYAEYRTASGFITEFRVFITRATGAGSVSVPSSGNFANITLCTIPSEYAPLGKSAGISTSSTGRIASAQVSPTGEINLAAIAPGGGSITEGESFALAGLWIRN